MTIRDALDQSGLQAKYGTRHSTPPEIINAAIRAECPGGTVALDALMRVHQIIHRHQYRHDEEHAWRTALESLAEIVRQMEDSIRTRYHLPART